MIKDDKTGLLDDLARMAGGAASLLSALRRQISEEVRAHVDETAQRLDLVPREDHDRLADMVAQLRMEQEAIRKELAELKGRSGNGKANGK